ncbi:MAG: hypothetical protein ACLFM1_04895 [Bacteroidales bacterium]
MCIIIVFQANNLSAQGVAINEDGSNANSSAMLDVKATDKGVLIPRVDIANLSSAAPIASPADGLLVYNINTTTGQGYYYWNGSEWVQLTTFDDERPPKWSGTSSTSSDIGRTGQVGLGTTSPQSQFHITEDMQIGTDGFNRDHMMTFWAENGYEANLVMRETPDHGMGIRYNANDNKLYFDRYADQTTPTPLFALQRDAAIAEISGTLDMHSNQIHNLDCDGGSTDAASCGWVNANDDNTTYSAGNQLSLSGTTFNVSEGSGSGLDADLLDGQHGSYYLDNTDNQNISGSGLSGTSLTIGIENGSNQTVDLSSLKEWNDQGDYLTPKDGNDVRIYENTTDYHIYTSHAFDNYGIYFYRSGSYPDGTDYDYNDTKATILGANYWGETYSFAIHGASFLDYDRSGGTFGGDWYGDDWGCLAYQNSSGTEYGGYFSGGYTGGAGKSNMNNAHVNCGIGVWGDLFGADIHGNIYGAFIEGGRYASYNHGNTYKDGYDVHLQDVGRDNMAVMYTSVSTNATVTTSGYGSLNQGNASIQFSREFKEIIDNDYPVVVSLTPIGESNGIHITEVTNNGFNVSENSDGQSNIEFTWIAHAKRKGIDNGGIAPEVVKSDYVEKLHNGQKPDASFKGQTNGLYFKNGQIINERHQSTISNKAGNNQLNDTQHK